MVNVGVRSRKLSVQSAERGTRTDVQRQYVHADNGFVNTAPPAPVDFVDEDAIASERMPDSQADEQKPRKKELKRLYDATRPLDGWERYRALVDTTDEAYELIDISNREARFALILMGAVNAVPVLVFTKADLLVTLSPHERYWIFGLGAGYVLIALATLLQAIEALRPGRFRPHLDGWHSSEGDLPIGVRYYEDIIQRSAHDYWKAWQEVRLSQLNAELAVQVHSLSIKNNVKHYALRRLYTAIRVMTLTLTGLGLLLAWFTWT